MFRKLVDRYVPDLKLAVNDGRLSRLAPIEVRSGVCFPLDLVVRTNLAELERLIALRVDGVHVDSARWEAVAGGLKRLHRVAFPGRQGEDDGM
jgi:hypothetical protein